MAAQFGAPSLPSSTLHGQAFAPPSWGCPGSSFWDRDQLMRQAISACLKCNRLVTGVGFTQTAALVIKNELLPCPGKSWLHFWQTMPNSDEMKSNGAHHSSPG